MEGIVAQQEDGITKTAMPAEQSDDVEWLRQEHERQAQDITALRQVAQMLGEQLIVARMKSERGTPGEREPGRVLVLEQRIKHLQHGLRAAITQRDHYQRLAASKSRLSTVLEGSPPSAVKEASVGEDDEEQEPESEAAAQSGQAAEEDDAEGEYFSDDIAAKALAVNEHEPEDDMLQAAGTSASAELNGTPSEVSAKGLEAMEAQTKLCNQLIEENTRLKEQLQSAAQKEAAWAQRRENAQEISARLRDELGRAAEEVSSIVLDSKASMSSVDERIAILSLLDASEDRCQTLKEELEGVTKNHNASLLRIQALERDLMLFVAERKTRREVQCDKSEALMERMSLGHSELGVETAFWKWAFAALQFKSRRAALQSVPTPAAAAPAETVAPPPVTRRMLFESSGESAARRAQADLASAQPRRMASEAVQAVRLARPESGAEGSRPIKQSLAEAPRVAADARIETVRAISRGEWEARCGATEEWRRRTAAGSDSARTAYSPKTSSLLPAYERNAAPQPAQAPSLAGMDASTQAYYATVGNRHSAPSATTIPLQQHRQSTQIPPALLQTIASPETRARLRPEAPPPTPPRVAEIERAISQGFSTPPRERREAAEPLGVTESAEPPPTSLILTAEWLATVGEDADKAAGGERGRGGVDEDLATPMFTSPRGRERRFVDLSDEVRAVSGSPASPRRKGGSPMYAYSVRHLGNSEEDFELTV